MRTNELSPARSPVVDMFAMIANALAPSPYGRQALGVPGERAIRAAPEKASRRRGLFKRLHHWLWTQRQRELEAHLAKAADVYDLEARLRAQDRSAPDGS